MKQEIQIKLQNKLSTLLSDHDKIVLYLEKNLNQRSEKSDRLIMGSLGIKTIFLEATIHILADILVTDFQVSLKSFLTEPHIQLIENIKMHTANKIDITDNGIKLDSDLENFVKQIKEQDSGSKQE